MARLLGVNIPDNKNIQYSLTYIYGIGPSTAKKILNQCNIDIFTKTKDIKTTELDRIKEVIEKNFKTEGDLKMEVNQNIKRLKEISCYRGTRHMKGLPARGQRTKTNARTKRGKRVCVGSGRRKVEKT